MAKIIEYDVSDVEESGGGTGVKVKPGVRVCEIVRANHRTQKRDGSPANDLELALSFGDEFDWVFTYVGLDKASDWKLAELVRAIGLTDKGKLNVDKLKGKIMRVKINSGEYNGNYSPDAGKFFPAQDDDEVGNTISAASTNGTSGGAAAADDEEPADEPTGGAVEYPNGFSPNREADPEVGSYDEWEDDDLVAEVGDRGLALAGGRGKKRDKAIAALRADDEAASAGGEATEPSDEAAAASDEYDEWDVAALTAEYEERQFDEPVPVKKGRNAEERTRTAIIEALRADDEANPFEG